MEVAGGVFVHLAENAFQETDADSVESLKFRLRVIADHVLSERHLKLCRLTIGESPGIAGLADIFYRMGIPTRRQSLIAAVDQVAPSGRAVRLGDALVADMLFGATVGKVLIDALLVGNRPGLKGIHASLDQVIGALFTSH